MGKPVGIHIILAKQEEHYNIEPYFNVAANLLGLLELCQTRRTLQPAPWRPAGRPRRSTCTRWPNKKNTTTRELYRTQKLLDLDILLLPNKKNPPPTVKNTTRQPYSGCARRSQTRRTLQRMAPRTGDMARRCGRGALPNKKNTTTE